ncbi:hypothetical protein ACFXIY_07530 [Streptomyces albidoflavus]
MRLLKRAAITLPMAAAITFAMTTSAHAGTDATAFTGWVYDTSEAGGKVTFKHYGEHLLIEDRKKDGNSAIGAITFLPESTRYYYWNRNGAGTTRDVNLSMAEGKRCLLQAYLGNWSGTATGGIDWNSTDAIGSRVCAA